MLHKSQQLHSIYLCAYFGMNVFGSYVINSAEPRKAAFAKLIADRLVTNISHKSTAYAVNENIAIMVNIAICFSNSFRTGSVLPALLESTSSIDMADTAIAEICAAYLNKSTIPFILFHHI